MENVGRIAIRKEDKFLKAYWAKPETMEGAILFASVLVRAVEEPAIFEKLLEFIQAVRSPLFRESIALNTSWNVKTLGSHAEIGTNKCRWG